jgi:carbamoyltransferase
MEDREYSLGLHLVGHDTSLTILDEEGRIIAISEEERYSRVKKGKFILSPQIILTILQEYKISPQDVKYLAIANIRELSGNRPQVSKKVYPPFANAKICDAVSKIVIPMFPNLLEVTHVNHHLCHAASAYLTSPFAEASVVTLDGMGENETATIWYGNNGDLTKLFSVPYPHSIGYLYQVAAQWVGLTGAEREGKLMGLASYGVPKYLDTLRDKFLSTDEKEGFVLNPQLEMIPCTNENWIKYFEHHFGRRNESSKIDTLHMDIASSIQCLLEEVMLHYVTIAKRLTNSNYLCAAGGVFMNSMANRRLKNSNLFLEEWIQPLASDNGLSLGASLWAFHHRKRRSIKIAMEHPFWGTEITDEDIEKYIQDNKISCVKSVNIEFQAAKYLAEGMLVGWIQGRSEVGARALGHRSILADPRDNRIKDKINKLIKNREYWRPFAPIVLEEFVDQYFEECIKSPFMMYVAQAKQDSSIPAALHVDNTGRLQTVNSKFDPIMYNLILEFKRITGIGALVNTSFNLLGEPIVRTIDHAYNDFINSGMDVLIVNKYVFTKPSDFLWGEKIPIAKTPNIEFKHMDLCIQDESPKDIIVIVFEDGLLAESFISIMSSNLSKRHKIHSPISGKILVRCSIDCLKRNRFVSYCMSSIIIYIILPVWTEIAIDTIPNLLRPFIALVSRMPNMKVYCVDFSGQIVSLQSMLPDTTLIVNGGIMSGIEQLVLSEK